MTPFAWLVLAHLVGDFMLQNDWMARNKGGHPWGAACICHCLLYCGVLTLTFGVLVFEPAQPVRLAAVAVFAGIIFASHWLIDGWRLAAHWGNVFGQTHEPFVRTVVDQTMHLLVLGVAVSLLLSA